jgi:hypothetical protein
MKMEDDVEPSTSTSREELWTTTTITERFVMKFTAEQAGDTRPPSVQKFFSFRLLFRNLKFKILNKLYFACSCYVDLWIWNLVSHRAAGRQGGEENICALKGRRQWRTFHKTKLPVCNLHVVSVKNVDWADEYQALWCHLCIGTRTLVVTR